MDPHSNDIEKLRPLLFSVAYNMLGSIADAEDMVQETFVNWLQTAKDHVSDPKAYLVRMVSNKCIDHLNKLRKQREAYFGTWLPEPVETASDPENGQQLSIGFLYLLEKLTPIERGVLVLREAFNMGYDELSRNFGISGESCRQHLSRAKKKLADEKVRFRADRNKHEKVLKQFMEACFTRNPEELTALLREDVTVYADGGGKAAQAVPNAVIGKEKTLRLLLGGMEKAPAFARSEFMMINGLACAAFYLNTCGARPDLLITVDVDANGRVANVYFLANPDKLKHLG